MSLTPCCFAPVDVGPFDWPRCRECGRIIPKVTQRKDRVAKIRKVTDGQAPVTKIGRPRKEAADE